MPSWRKLFVVGTLKQFYKQTMLSLHKKDSIKLEQICEHESSNEGVTAAALKRKKTFIIILQIPSERSEREKKSRVNR